MTRLSAICKFVTAINNITCFKIRILRSKLILILSAVKINEVERFLENKNWRKHKICKLCINLGRFNLLSRVGCGQQWVWDGVRQLPSQDI